MAITAAAVAYRIRIAAAGATSIGTPDLTLTQIDFDTTPIIQGPTVDLLEGVTTSHPLTVGVIVDTVLFTASNRFQVLGRLIEIQRNLDSGGWTSIATGRISNVSEPDGRGRIMLEISDERWTERRTQIFRTTTSVQLHPPGLAAAWMDEPAAGTTSYTVIEVSGSAVHIQPTAELGEPDINWIPANLRDALASDLVRIQDLSAGNLAGNFTNLRFAYSGGDRTVISFKPTMGGLTGSTSKDGPLGSLTPGPGGGILYDAWFYMVGHGLSATDTITGRFYFPNGIPTTESLPLHIGGAAGIHPMEMFEDILDGTYGGIAVNYDTTSLTNLKNMSLRPIWARLTGAEERSTWLQKNIYKVYAVAPLVGTDLVFRPTALRFPIDTDPDTLTTLTATTATMPAWRHTTRDLVNVLTFKSKFVRPISQVATPPDEYPIDGLAEVEYGPPDITHDTTTTLGEIVHEVDTDLIFQRWNYRFPLDEADELAVELFDIFGDGPTRYMVSVQDSDTHEVGDLVVLDFDTLEAFNPNDDDRTGDRVVRVISFRDMTPAGRVLECLDMGPDAQPLDAPTITVAQDGTNEWEIDVTIGGLSAGETATVELDINTVSPTTYKYVRSGVGNETITFDVAEDIGAGSQTAYGRTYATAPHRIRSAYATDTDALTVGARITSADVDKIKTAGVVTWTVPSGTLGIRTRYSIHDRGTAPTYGNQADYDAADGGFTIASVPLRSVVSVELTAYPGWTGAAVSGSAGAMVEVEALRPKVTPGPRPRRDVLPSVEVAFNADGEALVSAVGDEETANLYVTVGDGSAPSDPTVATNDGVISGRSGTVDTGIAITTGNEAYVRVIGADLDGRLGEVVQVRKERRIGPFHKDTTTRSHTGDTVETTLETITIPANTLGTNGGVVLRIRFVQTGAAGSKTLRIDLNTTTAISVNLGATTNNGWIELVIFNDGATNSQQLDGPMVRSGVNPVILNGTAAEDSTSDMDIIITMQLGNSGDSFSLELTHAQYIGTD